MIVINMWIVPWQSNTRHNRCPANTIEVHRQLSENHGWQLLNYCLLIHQSDRTGHPANLLSLVDPSHETTHVRIGMVAIGSCQASNDQFGICLHQRVVAMAVVEHNGQTLVRWRPTSAPHGRGHATCSPHHSWAPHVIPMACCHFCCLPQILKIQASQTNNFLLPTWQDHRTLKPHWRDRKTTPLIQATPFKVLMKQFPCPRMQTCAMGPGPSRP